MTLSTARSEKRAMEVGIRKSIGSTRGQLIIQFLSESFLIVLCAFGIALMMALFSLDVLNILVRKEIEFPWSNYKFWLYSSLLIVFITLLSGAYPALYLSSFKPIKILNGTFKTGQFTVLPRKILVITQFAISVTLFISTLVVMQQISYSKNRPVGYNKEGLIQIPTHSEEFNGKYDRMRNVFLSSGAVIEMSWSTSPTTKAMYMKSGFTWQNKPENLQENFAMTGISYEYIKSLGMKIIAGRDFSREFSTDSNAVVINQTAVKYMNLKKPVGTLIRYVDDEYDQIPLKIIGVVDDMVMQSPYEAIKPHLFVFAEGIGGYYNLRLNPDKSMSNNLMIVEKIFKSNFPNLPFQYDFVDEEYATKFASEEGIANLSKVFTLLTILISCLGLFGLASFMAEQRTKEIGIRKVLGATVIRLWQMLSKDFIVLVFIACLIAIPVAYYIMHEWLQKFDYRVSIPWWVFAVGAIGAIIITLITISFQTIKTAIANPVKSLRTE